MTTREKIIVGAMCLTIVYGAYELIGNRTPRSKTPSQSANPVEELKGFVASVSKKLVNEKVSEEYRYLIGQADHNWTKDPFLPSIAPLKKNLASPSLNQKPANEKTAPQYVYSGYLKLGDTLLAIINGMEYAVGESLNSSGLYIKSVSPLQVVVGRTNSRETIILPITEIDPPVGNQTP